MKTLLAVLALLLGLNRTALAQKEKIEGTWMSEEKNAKVLIYKANDGKFWGKIVWLAEPMKDGKPKVDEKNPKAALRNTPLMNYPLLRHFKKDSETSFDGGEIYDPKNGKTYSCTITVRNANELGIRGYMGISLLGRTTTWTRSE